MDFESGVIPVSRFVGRATTTTPEDLEARLRQAVVRSEEGELVGLLLVEVREFGGGSPTEDAVEDLFIELATASRQVDFVALVRPGLFVVLEPELRSREDGWETSESVIRRLSRYGTTFEFHLGLVFTTSERLSARDFFVRAEAELDEARESGNWSARRPLPALQNPLPHAGFEARSRSR